MAHCKIKTEKYNFWDILIFSTSYETHDSRSSKTLRLNWKFKEPLSLHDVSKFIEIVLK